MLPIPDFLPLVILPLWARLLTWLSAQVYARFLAPHDFFVQLAARLDYAPLEQACAAYQHTHGAGAQATHTVPCLVRALLVKYLWNLSLRELEYTIRTRLRRGRQVVRRLWLVRPRAGSHHPGPLRAVGQRTARPHLF